MAGVNVDPNEKRALNTEINMVPMIDLLMVTISFLLITAVWSHMARLEADARVPGVDPAPCGADCAKTKKRLVVDMKGADRFVLAWKEDGVTVRTVDVPRHDVVSREGAVKVVRFPELADAIASEWRESGSHRSPSDPVRDEAVLHADDATPYAYLIAAIDAVYQVERPLDAHGKRAEVPAFNVTFATAN
jgi:Biopolymer transport protein ExbD/TolR